MKRVQTRRADHHTRSRSRKGFSLIELMVAMALFIIIAGAAFSVFNQHATLAVRQQSLSGVNIGLRNGMAQLQMDLAGAGQNLLSTVTNAPSFDLGLIVQNNVPGTAATCSANTSTWAYPTNSACFDGLTIFNIKPCTTGAVSATTAPVLDINDALSPENLSTAATSYADDPMNTGVAGSLTRDATCFSAGDELLYVTIAPGGQTAISCADGTSMFYCLTTTTLTANASEVTASGIPSVKLPINLVSGTGGPNGCPGSSCSDSLGILGTHNFKHALQDSFPSNSTYTTYIVDLGTGSNDISYAVMANPSNAADPQLMRCNGASCTATNGQIVTDQVIGFKVGAALWDNARSDATDIANYFYDSSQYCSNAINGQDCVDSPTNNDPYDFALVRSVRISMIGRTVPQEDQTMRTFQNGFDQGPYLVQQTSVVVDLRNMSIPDFGN